MNRLKLNQQKRSRKFLLIVFTVGMMVTLFGCGEKTAPREKTSKTAASKEVKKPVDSEAKGKKEASSQELAYHYDPMGKKDPFKPFVKEEKLPEGGMERGPLTPLQKYSLNELKLVAVVVGLDNPKAMVEDSKGDGYIIGKGTLIGNKYGEVIDIRENEVVIVEKDIDPRSGEALERTVSLVLEKSEEEEL